MDISLKHLKGLLKTLAEGGASEFEYQDDKFKVRVVRGRLEPSPGVVPAPVMAPLPAVPVAPAPPSPEPDTDQNVAVITSPFVGTFYRAPAPGAEPFVQVGTKAKQGQTLCIVEAMKLMNEIESTVNGTVEKVLLKDGEVVEFGEVLFLIRPE